MSINEAMDNEKLDMEYMMVHGKLKSVKEIVDEILKKKDKQKEEIKFGTG